MEIPTQPAGVIAGAHERRITVLMTAVIVIVLGAWLWNTPPGLLGKADAVGYSVCHRIDSRSFHLGDRALPVCARCSGMFLGALLGMVYLLARYPRRAGMPRPAAALPLLALVGAFAVDGSNSYLQLFPNAPALYEPNNLLRLLTGTGVGLGIAAVLVPVVHQVAWKTLDERPALGSMRALLPLLGMAALLDLAIWSENPLLLYPLALLSAVGILMILTLVYALVWLMIWKRENRVGSWKHLLLPLLAGFLTAMLQVVIIDLGRYWLTGSWSGFNL